MSTIGLVAALAIGGACPSEAAALRAAADVIERRYVVREEARRIADDLRLRVRRDAYRDVCRDPAAFVARVNRELDAYDGHFHFERVTEGPQPDDWLMAWRAGSREANAGVRAAQVLEGNVGYLRLSSFYPWDLARPKLAAGFALLADADALILDLRGNGGGDGDTAGQVLRALLDPSVTSVQDVERLGTRHVEALPGAELPPFPMTRRVAILVDRRSASAAEFVAYSLQAAGRAIVVGQRSAGAAHMFGDPVGLPGRYSLTLPDARPLNRTTGGNWEGRGVEPDVAGGDDPLFVARQQLARPVSRTGP